LTWLLVAGLALAELLTGTSAPIEVITALALGIVIGSATNLLFGIPQEDLSLPAIREAFKQHDLEIVEIRPVRADARGSVPYFCKAKDGQEYFVKFVGGEQRNADFIFKLYRTALLKNVTGAAPYLTPMQGVRTPDVEFTARVQSEFALLAQKRVPALAMTDLPDGISDGLLVDVWREVLKLHQARIAHGDLRLANILIDENNKPWIIDFGYAAAGADEAVLAQDTAQTLASLTPVVGAERTVKTARYVLGPAALAAALPALEPLALSSKTREDLRYDPDFLEELKTTIIDESGAKASEEHVSVFRIRRQNLVFLVSMGLGLYILLPQLGQFDKVIAAWRSASPYLLLLGTLGSALTYVSAAISQQGAVEKTLDFVRLVFAQFAATFGARLSPQGVGGVYVNEQFIEKSGVRRQTAVTAITVNSAASAVVHAILIVITFALLGISGLPGIKDIQPWQLALGIGLLLLVAIFLLRYPEKLAQFNTSLKDSLNELRAILRLPIRRVQLFGGATAITVTYMATLVVSLYAVGANISVIDIAAVYLAASIIGNASPTPGGLGAMEAAFVAGLTTFGLPTDAAVAGTLLYRLLTFWLPIIPGFFAFRFLQRENYL
jgi:undecaprenyl-diphosphatase